MSTSSLAYSGKRDMRTLQVNPWVDPNTAGVAAATGSSVANPYIAFAATLKQPETQPSTETTEYKAPEETAAPKVESSIDIAPYTQQQGPSDYETYINSLGGTQDDGVQNYTPPPASSTQGKTLIAAKKYMGVPYKWGGTNPATGLDCSGFTMTVAKDAGVSIPRTASQQYNWFKQRGALVSQAQAKPGDLVYFKSSSSPSGWHTGLYIGNGKMIDASGKGRPVAVRSVWSKNVLGFGRLPGQPSKQLIQ